MSSELVNKGPEPSQLQTPTTSTPRSAHPWAQAFGRPGERVMHSGKGWAVRVIHFPTGPEVVGVEGPLAEQWEELYARLLRQGFRPEQATALLVFKSQQLAEGELNERQRQQRRLAFARYLVGNGRLSDGVPAPEKAAPHQEALAAK